MGLPEGLLSLVEPSRVDTDRDKHDEDMTISQNYFSTLNWNSRCAIFRVLTYILDCTVVIFYYVTYQ